MNPIRSRASNPAGIPALLLPLFLVLVSGCGEPAPAMGDASSRGEAGAAAAEHRLEIVPPRIVKAVLPPGGTLDGVLAALSVPADLKVRLIEALDEDLDLRRMPPRTGLAAVWTPGGVLASLACRTEEDRYLRLDLHEDGRITTTRHEVPMRVEIETTGGIVESSVAQALSGDEYALPLTADYADIFQWDVDLLIDPRAGDVARIVYEVKIMGEAAADLPPFGNRDWSPGGRLGHGRILAASYEGKRASAVAYLVVNDEGEGNYYDGSGKALRKTFLKSPLNYRRISSGFSGSRRHPITRRISTHYAVDFAAPSGTPVVASADGKVVSAGWDGHLGRAVRIRHGSEYVTIYGHLRAFARGIRAGAGVRQNQLIGFVGATGRATGPHLHYVMMRNGSPINPLRFRSPSAEPLPEPLRPRLEEARNRWGPVLASILPPVEFADVSAGEGEPGNADRAGG